MFIDMDSPSILPTSPQEYRRQRDSIILSSFYFPFKKVLSEEVEANEKWHVQNVEKEKELRATKTVLDSRMRINGSQRCTSSMPQKNPAGASPSICRLCEKKLNLRSMGNHVGTPYFARSV